MANNNEKTSHFSRKGKRHAQDDRYYLASQWTLMRRKLAHHKLARGSLVILGILYLIALFGNFVAPYSLTAYDSTYKDVGPTAIHFIHDGEYIGPFVYKMAMQRDPVTYKKVFSEDVTQPCKIRFFE